MAMPIRILKIVPSKYLQASLEVFYLWLSINMSNSDRSKGWLQKLYLNVTFILVIILEAFVFAYPLTAFSVLQLSLLYASLQLYKCILKAFLQLSVCSCHHIINHLDYL